MSLATLTIDHERPQRCRKAESEEHVYGIQPRSVFRIVLIHITPADDLTGRAQHLFSCRLDTH